MTRLSLRAGAVLATLSAVLLSGCEAYDLPLPGSPVDKDHAISLTADFNSVLDLVPRSPVKVNDVTVGEVTEVRREGWHATTTMRIQEDVDLPGNVVADIRQTSLLGEKYIALEPAPGKPETGHLSDGDHIPLSATGENPELEQVLGALSFLLNGGGVGQLKTITTELNQVFEGRQDRVRHVLEQLDVLVGGLDEQKQDIIHAMEAMNGLAGTLNREKRTVTSAIDEFGPAVKVLADQRAELMRMLRSLDRLGEVGTRVINASKDDLIADLRHLLPVVREIARANERIPAALGLLASFPFPIESNDIVHGDYANTSIVFSIDLDNLYKRYYDDGSGQPQDPSPLPDLGGILGGGGPKLPGGGPELPGLSSLPGFKTSADTGASSSATDLAELMGGGHR